MTEADAPEVHDGEPARQSPEDLRNAMERWWAATNRSHVVNFHNAVRALLKEKYQSPEIEDDPALRSVFGLYDKMNAGNTLLIALAWLEEFLYHVWRDRHPKKRPPKRGSMIGRYKRVLKELGVHLGGGNEGGKSSWSVLKDAEKIRHCLLHTNGRISLMVNPPPDEIRGCIERHEGLEEEGHVDRVRVTSVFLGIVMDAMQDLQDEILDRWQEAREEDLNSKPSE